MMITQLDRDAAKYFPGVRITTGSYIQDDLGTRGPQVKFYRLNEGLYTESQMARKVLQAKVLARQEANRETK